MDVFTTALMGVLGIGAVGTGLIVVAAYLQDRGNDRPDGSV